MRLVQFRATPAPCACSHNTYLVFTGAIGKESKHEVLVVGDHCFNQHSIVSL